MLKILGFFIPAELRANEDMLLRCYLLVGISLINSVINLLGVFTFLFLIQLPADIAWIAMTFVTVGLIGYGLILVSLRYLGSYALASNAVVLMLLAMIYVAIQITGGFSGSVMVQLCFLSPAMAFLLTGFHTGLFWLVMTCILSALSLLSVSLGIPYWSLLPAEYSELFGVILHFVLFFMVGGAIALFEWVNLLLTSRVKTERQKYRDIASAAADSSVVTDSAGVMADSAGRMFDSALQQKSAIEELLVTTETLNTQAKHNHTVAKSTRDAIQDVWNHVDRSRDELQNLQASMADVQASSARIQTVNNLINDIARQTNLLSLNAMIEAARSTETSGGFGVVALEVKRLAGSAAQAAHDINALLESNFQAVQACTQISVAMQQRFADMTSRFEPLVSSAEDISNASYEQGEAIAEITRAMADIDRAVNENRDIAEQATAVAAELRGNAQQLAGLMSSLQVGS